MKLSEAIRLGSMQTQPTRGRMRLRLFDEATKQYVVTHTCALGAAEVAMGKDEYRLLCAFDELLDQPIQCPVCPGTSPSILAIVVHINDLHCWTRERIADWVEQHEHLLMPKAEEREVVSCP
jgi:hypothetical protein